jgi:hypothetical protein
MKVNHAAAETALRFAPRLYLPDRFRVESRSTRILTVDTVTSVLVYMALSAASISPVEVAVLVRRVSRRAR